MMKVAIPHWQGRVSPVFDVAGAMLVAEVDEGVVCARTDVVFDGVDPSVRVMRLRDSGAEPLICGAISRPVEAAVVAGGIEVIAQICGPVEQVLAAFIDGRLDQQAFWMPGCCGRRRRIRGRRGRPDRPGQGGGLW